MGKLENLTGQRFGLLTVVGKADRKDKSGGYFWLCRCDCGGERLARATSLRKGETKCCGCDRYKTAVHPGERYGMLTVLSRAENRQGRAAFLCRCDCGMEKIITTAHLRSGAVKSCGCLTAPKDLTGRRFGKLTALEQTDQRNSAGRLLWRCVCDCGKEKLAAAAYLKSSQVKSCGSPPLGWPKAMIQRLSPASALLKASKRALLSLKTILAIP